jgi:carboxyl-terminal processing protease
MLDGDRILSVEDLPVSPATPLDDVQAAIRGPVGQALRLTIARAPDFTPQELLVKRAEVPLPSVTWNPAPGDPATGVIQVNTIAATTPEEIRNAIAGLRALGCDGFVLDLRNNGGGLLDAGVAVARLFLESGTVMTEQYRGEPEKVYPVERAGEFAGLPLVVWINQNTASAAEIIAGALQANGRAKLVGAPSYGKDSIQLVYDLSDGSSLHVTAAHWWLAGQPGNGLAGVGLQPDLPVEDDPTRPGAYLAATRSIFEAR